VRAGARYSVRAAVVGVGDAATVGVTVGGTRVVVAVGARVAACVAVGEAVAVALAVGVGVHCFEWPPPPPQLSNKPKNKGNARTNGRSGRTFDIKDPPSAEAIRGRHK